MSKFKRKRNEDKSERPNLAEELDIISQLPETTQSLLIPAKILDATEDLTALIFISTLTMIPSYTASDVQP